MRDTMLTHGLLLLVLSTNSVVLGGYYGEHHDLFRRLCVPILLPASSDNGPQLGVFKQWWNYFLNDAGSKIFPNVQVTDYMSTAEEHCKVLKPENDPMCAYRDFVNIGKLMEQDLSTFKQTMGSSDKTPSYYYRAYSSSWLEHPKVYRLECSNDMNVLWEFMADLSKVVVNENTNMLTDMKNVFNSSHAAGLRGEIEKTDCSRVASQKFCKIKYFTEVADKSDRLFKAYGTPMWDRTKTVYKTAMQLHFYGVKLQAPEAFRPRFLSTEDNEVKTWMRDVLADIVQSLREGSSKYDRLINVGDLLPPSHYLPCDILAEFPSLAKSVCTFSGVIYPLKPYVQGLIVAKKGNRKLVSTTIDYEKYLKQKRFEQILGMVETTHYTLLQIAKQLEYEMRSGTKELKSYFQAAADFDMQVAQADVHSITGDLKKYEQKSTKYANELDELLKGIIGGAWTAVIGDFAERTALLAMNIAEACNPGKTIFGGGAAQDILTSTQDLMQALANIPRLGKLTSKLKELLDESAKFIINIQKSEKMLKPVRTLINELDKDAKSEDFNAAKDEFISLYGDYDPVVGSDDVAGLSAFWSKVIEEGCGILESTSGAVSGGVKAVTGGMWLCPKADIAVSKLIAVYEELVQYQSSMMDTMLNYIRATATYNAANVINKDYTLKKPEGIDLELLAGFSSACYRVAIFSAMESYCRILEYREGEIPNECLGGRTITSLTARTEKTCVVDDRSVAIPTKPSHANDSAFIDLKSLYAGETVTFQVPNVDWLVDHAWIPAAMRRSKFFVHRFVLYLPTVSEWEKEVTVTAASSTGNKHHPPEGTEFILKPTPELLYSYKEGKHKRSCGQLTQTNFYKDSCRNLPTICPTTRDDEVTELSNRVYPTIYGRWHLRVQGYETTKLTVPASQLQLRARLQICHFGKSQSQRSLSSSFLKRTKASKTNFPLFRRITASSARCCSTGYYFEEAKLECTKCPPGSESIDKYDGLLCGDVTQLVMKDANITDMLQNDTSSEDSLLTFAEAQEKCRQLNTHITTPASMDKAVSLGYDKCACGWLSDGTKRAPRPAANCTENVGAQSGCTGREKWPVYCGTNF